MLLGRKYPEQKGKFKNSNHMKVHHFLYSAICILLMVISCQKEPQVVKVESVSLNSTSMTMVEGDSQSLTATVSPSNADNKKVSWSSSNSSVASVDDRGTVTAIAPGTATITAKTEDGGKTATCSVTVNSRVIAVESVSLDKTELEIIEGDNATLVATVLPENADNKNVIWTSSDESVATVKDGVVTAIKEGEATITAKTEDGEKTAACSVTVIAKSKVKALCFTADGEQSISLKNEGGNTPSLQYSYNGIDWTDWDYSALSFGTNEHKFVFIRGNNPNGFSQTTEKFSSFSFSTSCKVQCTGNVMHLLNYSEDLTEISNDYCFACLFSVCTSLVTAPELPATTLADYCYWRMFSDCTSLVTAPELPATTLADYCYWRMFSDCTSLVTAPELPATTLAGSCYSNMFGYCTSLVTAPELPATTLADWCYVAMFTCCTSLVNAPELPATTLAEGCYGLMFGYCSSLVTAPELPATTLADWCYNSMFSGCTNLVSAPELPATTLAENCYEQMFYGCTSLVNAPELPATTLADSCYSNMFHSCTSLVSAPDLPATTLDEWCYSFMFSGCTSLNTITCLAEDIYPIYHSVSGWLEGVSSTGTFIKSPNCNSWPRGSSGIPDGWQVVDYTGE